MSALIPLDKRIKKQAVLSGLQSAGGNLVQKRLEMVKKDIHALKSKLKELNAIWEQEKARVARIQALKEKVEGLTTDKGL